MEEPVSVITAASVTVTRSERFPYFNAKRAVMIFVVLAGFICCSAFFWNSAVPPDRSNTPAASAVRISSVSFSPETTQRSPAKAAPLPSFPVPDEEKAVARLSKE